MTLTYVIFNVIRAPLRKKYLDKIFLIIKLQKDFLHDL